METIKRMIDDAYGHLHTASIQWSRAMTGSFATT